MSDFLLQKPPLDNPLDRILGVRVFEQIRQYVMGDFRLDNNRPMVLPILFHVCRFIRKYHSTRWVEIVTGVVVGLFGL